ncbi:MULTISPECIES: dihydropteroate synthase [unclassified Gemella]|uniref:dihydropteroate synthase n=1 Tax=unclassified Gemella TaxID=2624949 RepID=UPI001C044056|nr:MULTISPECIES: dihydropteroate synthase [unclassified Gemella]MBU0278964.1 dihydropteroate synthase [Gemella sp. zg-1178]QWQ39072.1 dihydropteroate synthase [Gemella sp. zg-570]
MTKLQKLLTEKKYLIMGILNFTPDSFSDGGDFFDKDLALNQVKKMLEDGADIIDVGCESTRPGAKLLSEEEEIARLSLILPSIRKNFPDILISIDTYKARVAKEAIKLGANIINDVHGAKNNNMAEVAFEYNLPIIIMHNGATQKGREIESLIADLQESLNICLRAGVKKENIIVDPGIGFGKNAEENIIITKKLAAMNILNSTIQYAASRKRTTDFILGGNTQPKDRDIVSATLSIEAIKRGAKIVRMHNVKVMKEMLDTLKILEKF